MISTGLSRINQVIAAIKEERQLNLFVAEIAKLQYASQGLNELLSSSSSIFASHRSTESKPSENQL